MGEEPFDFAAVEDGGEVYGAPGGGEVAQVQFFSAQHFLVEEEQGVEGLVLGGGGDVALDGEVVEIGDDFGLAHLFGVALAVEEDEPLGPVEVGLLGADAIVAAAEDVAHLAEQPGAAHDAVGVYGDVSIGAVWLAVAHGIFLDPFSMRRPGFYPRVPRTASVH